MRCYSLEKTKEREEELRGEVDRIHAEIKILQKTNEDSATISDKLSREVSEFNPIESLCIQNDIKTPGQKCINSLVHLPSEV